MTFSQGHGTKRGSATSISTSPRRTPPRDKLYLYVAIDQTSKHAFVQVDRKTGGTSASAFLMVLIQAVRLSDPNRSDQERHPVHVPTTLHSMRCSERNIPGPKGMSSGYTCDQGRDRQALSLRRSSPVRNVSRRLHRGLQFASQTQAPQRPHAFLVYLQMLDFRARTIHPRSNPSHAGTKRLPYPVHRQSSLGTSVLINENWSHWFESSQLSWYHSTNLLTPSCTVVCGT